MSVALWELSDHLLLLQTPFSVFSYSQRASRMNAQLQTFIKYFIHRFHFQLMKSFFETSIEQL